MNLFFQKLLKNRLWIHYFTILIVLCGIMAAFSLRREARPSVNFDRVAISVNYRGASAEDVEQLVLKPLEEAIDEIDGIEEYRSTAFEGIGSISVKMDPNYEFRSESVDDISQKIEQTVLPDDVDDPVVFEIKANKITILSLALYGDVEDFKLRNQANLLKEQLKRVEGVSSITSDGLNDLEFSIQADKQLLKKNYVSVSDIMDKLRNWNAVSPAGEIDDQKIILNLRIDEQLKSIEDIKNLPIRVNDAGRSLRIKDVAKVILRTKATKQEILLEGNNAIRFSVVKKESEDIITTVERVKKYLKNYEKSLPENIKLNIYYDDSKKIKSQLKIVMFNALFGLFLVLIVLMLTLNFRVAIITSIGLPVAFLGGLAFLWWAGMTINTLVVLGMIVVLGMLVDDAIVVSENIYSYIEKGHDPFAAALKGVGEVASPVLATVMTTIFAFLPIVFMQGIMGQFLKVIPITVVLILLFSLIEALTILPVHAAELLKTEKSKPKKLMIKIQNIYTTYVKWSLDHKFIVFAGLFIFMALTVFTATKVKFILFPSDGIQSMSLRTQLKINTSIKVTKDTVAEISKAVRDEVGKDIFSISSDIGKATLGGVTGSREQSSNIASTKIIFTDDPSFLFRERGVIAKVKSIAKKIAKEKDISISASINRPGPPIGKAVEIMVASKDFDLGKKIVTEIEAEAQKIDGIINIQNDLQSLSEQYKVKIKKEQAIERGLNLKAITSTVFSSFYGVTSSTTRIGNDEVDLVVTFKDDQRNLKNLMDLSIASPKGGYIPLKSIAEIKKVKGRNAIQRLNGARTITVFSDVEEDKITAKEANSKLNPVISKLGEKYPDAVIDIGGSEKDRMNALKDTGKLYVFALVAIFMVISLSFNSVLFPFFAIFSIPFGLCGVVWALLIHGKPLSMMGMIGVVGLSGVVVNGAIILVQFILEEIRAGSDLRSSIIQGVQRRLRPILITTVTTLVGLAPTIYSLGGKDPFIQPLALSLGWGLFVATLLTLSCLPAIIYFWVGLMNIDKIRNDH